MISSYMTTTQKKKSHLFVKNVALSALVGSFMLVDAFQSTRKITPSFLSTPTCALSNVNADRVCGVIHNSRSCNGSRLYMVLTDPETLLGREEIYFYAPDWLERRSSKNSNKRMSDDVKKLNKVFNQSRVVEAKEKKRCEGKSFVSARTLEATPSREKPRRTLTVRKQSPATLGDAKSTKIFKDEAVTLSTHDERKTRKTKKARQYAKKVIEGGRTVSSKSSTMPGFEFHDTERVRAHKDGIEFVEKRSKRKIRKEVKSIGGSSRENSRLMYTASASVPDSLIQFTDEIHKETRITHAEEKELGTKTQEAIRLQSLHDNLIAKLNRQPTDAEYCAAAGKINMEAIRQTIDEGLEAKNKLVTSNLRMVQRVVNLYLRNGLGSQFNAGDMMQDGTLALIRAAEKYEPQRGFRFSTYAMYWIRSSVKRSQILQSRVIVAPQRLHENYKRVDTYRTDYFKLYRLNPTYAEIAKAVNLTEVQVERCVIAIEQKIYSLDAEITNPYSKGGKNTQERKETMYGLISNTLDEMEDGSTERTLLKEDLIKSLRTHLAPIDVDLILLRYGLMDEKTLPHGFSGPLTINEVSKLVGMKPDKVRRMINKSLQRLKFVIGNEWKEEII